jgi:hypothetical protein
MRRAALSLLVVGLLAFGFLVVGLDGHRWRTLADGPATGRRTTGSVRPTLVRRLPGTSAATAGNWRNLADTRPCR